MRTARQSPVSSLKKRNKRPQPRPLLSKTHQRSVSSKISCKRSIKHHKIINLHSPSKCISKSLVSPLDNSNRFMSSSNKPDTSHLYKNVIVREPKGKHTNTLIFIHGLGDEGKSFDEMFSYLLSVFPQTYSNTRFVFPTAPIIPITANGGYRCTGWYDIVSFDRSDGLGKQDKQGIEKSGEYFKQLLDAELTIVDNDASKLVLGGFSQGGAMALFSGLQYNKQLGGLIVLSSYLTHDDEFLPSNNANIKREILSPHTPIFYYHGKSDDVVPYKLAQRSVDVLQQCGVDKLTFLSEANLGHSTSQQGIVALNKWYLDNIINK